MPCDNEGRLVEKIILKKYLDLLSLKMFSIPTRSDINYQSMHYNKSLNMIFLLKL